jgi:hypothetical protein
VEALSPTPSLARAPSPAQAQRPVQEDTKASLTETITKDLATKQFFYKSLQYICIFLRSCEGSGATYDPETAFRLD